MTEPQDPAVQREIDFTVPSERVTSAVQTLLADAARLGRPPSQSEFDRVTLKKGLSAEDRFAVLKELQSLGMTTQDPLASDDSGDEAESRRKQAGGAGDLVARYLRDINQSPLLSQSEEVDLARAIDAGRLAASALGDADTDQREYFLREVYRGLRAKNRLVECNLRLVVHLARQYLHKTSGDFLDMIQDGTLGLIRAAEKFDWRRSLRFSTYAYHWINQSITRGLADHGRTIRLPVHVQDNISRLRRARRKLLRECGPQNVTDEMVAEQLGWDAEFVAFLDDVNRDVLSINAAIGGG